MEETATTIDGFMVQCNNPFGGQSMSWAPRPCASAGRARAPGAVDTPGRRRMTAQDSARRPAYASLE
jgi:hypothetical protein